MPAELHCKGFRSAITGKLASLPSHGRRAERRSRKETRPICRFGAKKCPPPPTGYESRVDGRSQVIAFEAHIHLLALRSHQAVLPHLWCGTWRSGLARVGPTGGRTRNKGAARRRPRHPRPGPRRSARTISSVRRPTKIVPRTCSGNTCPRPIRSMSLRAASLSARSEERRVGNAWETRDTAEHKHRQH